MTLPAWRHSWWAIALVAGLASGLGAARMLRYGVADAEPLPQGTPVALSRTEIQRRYQEGASRLAAGRYGEAIALLQGLETDSVLGPWALGLQAQARQKMGDRPTALWEKLAAQDSGAAAEALWALGRTEELVRRFPGHPRARQVWRQQLQAQPNRWEALVGLGTYFADDQNIEPILNRLTRTYGDRLTPAQWWQVADGYFYARRFEAAARAYGRATPHPFTSYRVGRSWQRANKRAAALAAYQRTAAQFPGTPAAGRALLRAMEVAESDQAIALAERAIAAYPDLAAEALYGKFQRQRGTAAAVTRRQILDQHPRSESAAQILVTTARQQAQGGNPALAARTLATLPSIPTSEIVAEGLFWGGKWASDGGDRELAQRLWQRAIAEQPRSYYAWRSAARLGWPTGNFTNVRALQPEVQVPPHHPDLPAGSAAVQELFALQRFAEASAQWQVETRGQPLLDPAAIFTDGVLRVATGDFLVGMYQLDSLNWLDVTPAERDRIRQLQQNPNYERFLYPLAYWEGVQQHAQTWNLNPLLVLSLIRQESRFEADIRSVADAVGLMQVIPETGAWIAAQLGVPQYSLTNPDQNLRFGTFYLNYTHNRYQNNSLLAIASYNAGPNAVARWVTRSFTDPDEFVARIPYRETREYVGAVFGNYWNYLRLYTPLQQTLAQLAIAPR
ncbi:MAG: lytic transglycosylase domain-containing protein [Pseudanabaenaceae cyanobacterium]